MDNQSLMKISTKESLGYSSYGCLGCEKYQVNALITDEMDDIMKDKHITHVNHYYIYDIKQFSKDLTIKCNAMSRMRCNTINNNNEYLLIIICLFIFTQYLARYSFIMIDYCHRRNINYNHKFHIKHRSDRIYEFGFYNNE